MAAVLTGVLGLSSGNVSAQTTLTLDLSDTTYTNWTDTVAGNPPDCTGGYWDNTYNDVSTLRFGDFVLSHTGTSGFWGGFTTGSNGNSGEYGLPCTIVPCYADSTHAGSLDWICNQWGVMAGGGLNSDDDVVKGAPYLIAYWNYYSDEQLNTPSLTVNMADNSLFNPLEIYICNHPWPYYGNIKGDGFARPLNQPGDHFDLIIHAVKPNRTDSLIVPLAEYNSSDPDNPIQSPNWRSISLTSLGDSIQSLYFTMFSTDEYPGFGPNTAVYFCMDKLTIDKLSATALTNNAAQKVKTKAATASVKKHEVADKMNLNSYTGGAVTVYDSKGKKVLETSIKAGGDTINLSNLPAGEYRVRHGHKVIPIAKLK